MNDLKFVTLELFFESIILFLKNFGKFLQKPNRSLKNWPKPKLWSIHVFTHSYAFSPHIRLHVHSAECTVRLLNKQTRIIIHTILNLWETLGIEPLTSGLTSLYQTSSSTT